MGSKTYKKFLKELSGLKKYLSNYRKNYSYEYGKVMCLSYLSVEAEKIFTNPKNLNPVSDMIKIIKNAKNFFEMFITFSKFKKKKKKYTKIIKNFKSFHQSVWKNIWPEYENQKEFHELMNYRGKRIDFNNITEFKNKNVIDFGSGNGSISFSLLKRNAKHVHLVDFEKKNIKASKIFAKKLKLIKKTSFEINDISKYSSKKKYDFVICSGVLHHLQNKKIVLKTLKTIGKLCNNDAHLYVFVRGKGGMRYAIQDTCRSIFKNTDIEFIKKILMYANFSRNKITHLLDWHKAIYLHSSRTEFESMMKKSGFNSFKRLRGPHKNDLDLNQINSHNHSKLKFGTGELRYLAKFTLKNELNN